MQYAEWNREVRVPTEFVPLKNNIIVLERNLEGKKEEPWTGDEKPILFNVAALHDTVWGGETEWRAMHDNAIADRINRRKEAITFNVAELRDTVWEGY